MMEKQIRKLVKSLLKQKYSEDDLVNIIINSYWLTGYDYQSDIRKSYMREDEIIKMELNSKLSTIINM